MITREEQKDPKKRILTVCVQMFIERGYKATTMLDIIREADVSSGTFQNIFRTKDGVLFSLTEFMFSNQFSIARTIAKTNPDPVFVYATETAIQLALAELNENLREIYIEAYTQPKLTEYINQRTSTELAKIFGPYNSTWAESDFYETEIGSSGVMRSFMAHRCDKYFTLLKKTEKFLRMTLDEYHVPIKKQDEIIAAVRAIDIVDTANMVMKQLFGALEMTFDFKFA